MSRFSASSIWFHPEGHVSQHLGTLQHAIGQVCFNPAHHSSSAFSARLPDLRFGGGRYEVGTVCTGSRLSDVRDGRDCWETCPSGWNRMEDAENRLIAEPAPIGTDRLGGQRCKYAEKSYMYKYDLGHTFYVDLLDYCKSSCIERERERERSLPPLCNHHRV